MSLSQQCVRLLGTQSSEPRAPPEPCCHTQFLCKRVEAQRGRVQSLQGSDVWFQRSCPFLTQPWFMSRALLRGRVLSFQDTEAIHDLNSNCLSRAATVATKCWLGPRVILMLIIPDAGSHHQLNGQ